jgi:hypothetical protein
MKPPKDNFDRAASGGCVSRLVRFFNLLWRTMRYKRAKLHVDKDIAEINRMLKWGWRLVKIDIVRIYGERGSFRDNANGHLVNKSWLGLLAPNDSRKCISEAAVGIGCGANRSNRDQPPSVVDPANQVPLVVNGDKVKLGESGQVDVGGDVVHNVVSENSLANDKCGGTAAQDS